MRKRLFALLLALGATAVLLLTLVPGTTLSQQIQEVFVVNFPSVQEVEGKVEVTEPIPSSKLIAREEIVVPPTRRQEIGSMVEAGVLDAEGFTTVTLSLYGEVKDLVFSPGTIGVLLVPDRGPIQRALDDGQIHLQMEVTAETDQRKGTYFSAKSQRVDLGFPRYRILFYNSGNRSVDANLYAYLGS